MYCTRLDLAAEDSYKLILVCMGHELLDLAVQTLAVHKLHVVGFADGLV